MTAIFAYASGDVAFVAGDTMRTVPAFGTLTVTKIHRWSEHVLIAQAGDGKFQRAMVAEVFAKRPEIMLAHSGLRSDEQFMHAFTTLRPNHYNAACKAVAHLPSGGAHITGTILLASAADSAGSSRIHLLDFPTGTVTPSPNDVEAEGQDPKTFSANARVLMPAHRSSGTRFQIDQWGLDCVRDAMAAYPKNIGWPVDLLLCRASIGGVRIAVYRRVDHGAPIGLPEFAI